VRHPDACGSAYAHSTTSIFTKEALASVRDYVSKIILIDGARLADFMIDHDVGVATSATILLKKLDSDFFDEEEAERGRGWRWNFERAGRKVRHGRDDFCSAKGSFALDGEEVRLLRGNGDVAPSRLATSFALA
jgi:hypothetical protein